MNNLYKESKFKSDENYIKNMHESKNRHRLTDKQTHTKTYKCGLGKLYLHLSSALYNLTLPSFPWSSYSLICSLYLFSQQAEKKSLQLYIPNFSSFFFGSTIINKLQFFLCTAINKNLKIVNQIKTNKKR